MARHYAEPSQVSPKPTLTYALHSQAGAHADTCAAAARAGSGRSDHDEVEASSDPEHAAANCEATVDCWMEGSAVG